MDILNFFAFASPNAGGGGSGGAGSLLSFLPLVLIFAVFWFMIIRPQKKQQEQRKTMLDALKRGDRVITNGGLYATIRDVKGDVVTATIGDNVKVEISRQAISTVLAGE